MGAGIIISSYNNEQQIAETINSVKNQTFKEWSCVIIDNGSTDNTKNLIQHEVEQDTRFAFFSKDNEGPSAGRNFGYSKLPESTEYIHFLDGDDILHTEFLSIMVSYLDQHPQVGLLGCQYDLINSKSDYIGPGYRSRYAPGFLGFPKKLSINTPYTPFETFFSATGQGAFAVFRNSVFKRTTGYEKDFWSHEDSDIFCQMALKAEVHYIPSRLYKVRIRENSLMHSDKVNYSLFRRKWDLYLSSDKVVNGKIEKGLEYYYSRHKPARDFKVAFKAFKEFIYTGEFKKMRWSWICFSSGINELFFHKGIRKIMHQRAQLQF